VGQNFDALQITLLGATLRYGAFITSVINFLILALVVFILVRAMNTLAALGEKKKREETAPGRLCPYCKSALHPEATRCPSCTSQL
jgi:large conductance mechanosensitive channel